MIQLGDRALCRKVVLAFCVFLDSPFAYVAFINHRATLTARVVCTSPAIQSPYSEPPPLSNSHTKSIFPESIQGQVPDNQEQLLTSKAHWNHSNQPIVSHFPCLRCLCPGKHTKGSYFPVTPSSSQNRCFAQWPCVVWHAPFSWKV